jgi:hypothetical protein
MSIPTQMPAPEPDDVSRGLAELELYVAGQAPALPAVASADVELLDQDAEIEGETKRVRELRAQVAEARLLLDLQEDQAPLILDTPRVRRRRRAAFEAARLHELGQDPAMRAWQAARMRRLLVVGAMVSLALALAWSTAGVQTFASEGSEEWSPGWVFAWLVEPFMSVALLVVVGARAFMGTRGQPIVSRTLVRIEVLFLALTLGMNAWPYLPGVADSFSFSRLVLHVLGPIVAVAIVTALPIILEAFSGLDHGHGDSASDLQWTHPDAPRDAVPDAPRGRSIDKHRTELDRLITSGRLPSNASARQIQTTLRCRAEVARDLWRERNGKGGAS